MMVKSTQILISALALVGSSSKAEEAVVDYGVDISFPMHHEAVSTNFAWLPHNVDPEHNPTPPEYQDLPIQPLGDRQSWYTDEYIQGCIDKYKPENKHRRCLNNEVERVEMSLRQPQSMVNYTQYGFTKIRAPDRVFKLLKEFWDANRDEAKPESWPAGNTYTNHWSAPSQMLSVEDRSLKGGGYVLKQNIWNAARDTISEWTGQQLAECSLYGIRIYPEGAVLAPHVDRLPLVSSAIINVDQDVDEPWPLEVIGHDGKAHNVTMVPGDLVLYESHSILHGRPFPLKGRFMANVFIHFEPIGPVGGELLYGKTDIPPYIVPGSLEDAHWRMQNPRGHVLLPQQQLTEGATETHRLVREGDLNDLMAAVDANEQTVNARDVNGWTPLHEAIRFGELDKVQFLLDRGSNVNARVGSTATGTSPLYMAIEEYGNIPEIVELLKERGAKYYGEGDREEGMDYQDSNPEF